MTGTAAQVLERFLLGEASLADTLSGLGGAVEYRPTSTSRQWVAKSLGVTVPVTPASLVPVLEGFLAHRFSPQFVSEWASFVLGISAYELPEDPENPSSPEPVREALWDLAFAPILKNVTEARVRPHVARLRSIAG